MDKIKLCFGDRNDYSWIEHGGATVCKIECYVNIRDICNRHRDKIKKLFPRVDTRNYYGICFVSTGVAKLSPDDKYDRILGRHIAEARAKQKAYSIANRVIRAYCDMLEEDRYIIRDFITESAHQYYHETDHIEYLIGKEE